jgi:rhodanese-related sulfurtransferase/glyoxylase-like metal-dependent hydrolase (beta-lactamase superfamily II)
MTGDQAASYQLIGTYDFPGMKLLQYDLAVLSHYSYLLISGDQCLVVDPGRDIAAYVSAAEQAGAEIIGVWLTHSHADFVAGHIEFARRLDVPLRISARANAAYEHIGLREDDRMQVGQASVRFIETPGHTPDSMCGLVYHRDKPDRPLALLSGDTLFIGSVGRPDLMGKGMSASSLASMMFDTWTEKLSKLPDDVIVLPAHGAGSLCGAHFSDDPSSTLGEQRTSNPYLQYTSRGEFIAAILEGLPEAPRYFSHNAALNRDGPPPVNWDPEPLPLVEPAPEFTQPDRYYVVDLRDAAAYAEGHIPNSVNIGLRGRFETWTGTMVPWDAKLLVAGNDAEIREAIHRLHRVGYQARGILMDGWVAAGLPLVSSERIEPQVLYEQMQTTESPVVVDVRLPSEWTALRIGTVVNLPLNQLAVKSDKLDPEQRIIAVCNSAYRSSLAVGVLQRSGFESVGSLEGGAEAWIEAGLPVYEATSSTAARPKRELRLPERISAAELKRLVMDLPGTFQLVDIRPADHFADYRIPESENVDVADLLNNPAYLTGAGPLVVVCRDGSLAMMVAGILSQKTERDIKALYGGAEAYWSESIGGLLSPAATGSPGSGAAVPAPTTSEAAPAAAKPSPAASLRRRKAGC